MKNAQSSNNIGEMKLNPINVVFLYQLFNIKLCHRVTDKKKVDYISDRIDDLDMLQDLDMRLGRDMPAIDKIYSFLKLEDMINEKYEQIELISNRQKDYE